MDKLSKSTYYEKGEEKRVFGDFARRVGAHQGHEQRTESIGTQIDGMHSFAKTP
jgi:hypothetical protein